MKVLEVLLQPTHLVHEITDFMELVAVCFLMEVVANVLNAFLEPMVFFLYQLKHFKVKYAENMLLLLRLAHQVYKYGVSVVFQQRLHVLLEQGLRHLFVPDHLYLG